MNRFGLGHHRRQGFVDTAEFGFLGCELRFDVGYLAEELVLLVEQVVFVVLGFAFLVRQLLQLFVRQFGQEHALEMEGRRVIELYRSCPEIDGLRRVVVGSLEERDDCFFELADLRVIGFSEPVSRHELEIIAVFGGIARHLSEHTVKDVNYFIYFDLVVSHLRQDVGINTVLHCCESFVLGLVCEWPLIARADTQTLAVNNVFIYPSGCALT